VYLRSMFVLFIRGHAVTWHRGTHGISETRSGTCPTTHAGGPLSPSRQWPWTSSALETRTFKTSCTSTTLKNDTCHEDAIGQNTTLISLQPSTSTNHPNITLFDYGPSGSDFSCTSQLDLSFVPTWHDVANGLYY